MAQSLTATKLADKLRSLRWGNASGVLSMTADEGTALIVLQRGQIVYASSDRVPPIGQSLLEKGLVNEPTLQKALMLQRKKKHRELIVGILISLGILQRDAAAAVLEDHIVTILREAMSWEQCQIHFNVAEGELDHIVFPPRNGDIEVLLERASGQ